jgi:hypothetical protein
MSLPGTGIVTDVIGGISGWTFDKIADGVAGWVLGGVAYFTNGVLNFLKTAARPQVDAAWFARPGSPFATVRNIAGTLMVGFAFLGVLQGLVNGDPGAMVRRIAADLPVAVLGIVATVTVTTKLLDLTDALSTAVLGQSDGQALHFLDRFSGLGLAGGGFAVVVVGLLAIVAALLLWIELMVRSALVYLLVAISPLAFAAMVWPAARGVLRRTSHLLLAVIASKFVIAVALAVGVAALGGTIPGANEMASGPVVGGAVTNGDPGAGLGMVFVGAVILSLAAFAPFIVLRLIPVAEAAVGAQGVSRGPARATQAGLGTYYYAHSLGRLGGSGAPTAGVTMGAAGSAPSASGAGSAGPAAGRAASGGGAATGAATATIRAARTAGRSAATVARDASQLSPLSGSSVKPESAGRPAATDPTRRRS